MTIYAKVTLVRHPHWLVEYAAADRIRRGKLLRKHGSTITELVKIPAPSEFEEANEARQHVIIQGEILHLPQYRSMPNGFRIIFEQLSEAQYRRLIFEMQESAL